MDEREERRLKKGGGAFLSPKTSMKGEVGIGIIGLGNMGQFYARALLEGQVPGLNLAAVCDVEEERTARFESVERFTDPHRMFQSEGVDAVHIATPHFFSYHPWYRSFGGRPARIGG